MILVVKPMHSDPQRAIETFFRVPISPISHFDLLGVKPEKK